MRLYVSGPITGYPDLNKPMFAAVTHTLERAGHTVLNPHDVCAIVHPEGDPCQGPCTSSEQLLPWSDYLRADLIAMLQQADGLAMLDGWELSRGARLEKAVADALDWEVKHWHLWL